MLGQSERETEKNDTFQQLINYGVPLLGAGASAAISSTLGMIGPEGAAIGGMVGKGIEIALSKVGQDISERHLSTREKVRLGAVLVIAAEEIRNRRASGEHLRDDGFVDEKPTGRSDAAEVVESVLLKVQREPEEKKIEYMGYLLASMAFDPQISVEVAHQLTKAVEQLTYRQLCILKFCEVKMNFGLLHGNYRGQSDLSRELYSIIHECHDLYRRGMIHFGVRDALGLYDVSPISMTIHELGSDLFNLMKLAVIPDEDIIPIADQLKSGTLENDTF